MLFEGTSQVYETTTVGGGDFLLWLSYIIIALGIAVFLWILFKRPKTLRRSKLYRSLDLVFLEIVVPKESGEDKFGQESTKQNEKELISIGEQLFTTIYWRREHLWRSFWHGDDVLTFEIAAFDKKIHFYITCPRRRVSVIERQLHAQYPKAVVEVVEPYRVFKSNSHIAAAEFGLQKHYVYPIKTYDQQTSDPLNAITNAMSKLTADESMVLQLALTPAPRGWDSQPRKLAEDIQQGKRPKEVAISQAGRLGKEVGKTVRLGVGDLMSASTKQQSLRPGDDKPIQLTPMQQEVVKKFEEKASKIGYNVNIRAIAASDNTEMANAHLNSIIASFTQYTQHPFNGFKVFRRDNKRIIRDFVLRFFKKRKMVLNAAELTSIWHPPTKYTETPNINWLTSRKASPPPNLPESGLLLGINEYRGVKTNVYIMEEDRLRHVYIIGRTGTGKTEIMKTMAAQDIVNGKGICIVDPHGEFIEDILTIVPKERADDVIIFDPSDMERPFGLNMLDIKSEAQADFVVQDMISIFEKLFPPEVIGPMFEHNMRNVMLTLVADASDPGTLVEIPRMFTDPAFQQNYVKRVKDPTVLSFWQQEMAKTSDFHKSEMLGYLISKVGRFVENTMMRNIIGQKRNSFDFREVMDTGKILLVNLSKGKIGELNSKLLGLIIVSKLQMAALSRADMPESERKDFYLYVDEFQNFVTDSFATILSEARKYRLGLVIAHQYLGQLAAEKPGSSVQDTKVRDAVFGNVGTMMAFRIGVEDAEVMAREMAPTFNEFDVVNIERFNAYVKLLIHNTVSRPFSIKTLPLNRTNDAKVVAALKDLSRLKYGRPRQQVESEILDRSQLSKIPLEPKEPGHRFA